MFCGRQRSWDMLLICHCVYKWWWEAFWRRAGHFSFRYKSDQWLNSVWLLLVNDIKKITWNSTVTNCFCFCVLCVCRGVWDAAWPAGAGGGCDAGVPLPSSVLSFGSGPKGGHAGRRCPHPGEAGRQEDPPRLPANDHKTGQRHHCHQQLEGGGCWETRMDVVYIYIYIYKHL